MDEIILDVAPNTFQNDTGYFARMVSEIKKIDTKKYKIIFKTQMFSPESKAAEINLPFDTRLLKYCFNACQEAGYQFTSSVFDYSSLRALLDSDIPIPFVKIACRDNIYPLGGYVPRNIPIYVSAAERRMTGGISKWFIYKRDKILDCVPEYPATRAGYGISLYNTNISDHTEGLKLFDEWQSHNDDIARKEPLCFEMHYVLERKASNPDAVCGYKIYRRIHGN
jgi:sialic acid synthase SpsE